MMRKIYLTLLLITLSFILISGCTETMPEKTIIKSEQVVNTEPDTEKTIEESNIKEFSVTAKKWDFIPETITVNKGDLVKITITSTDVTHGIKINEYDINEIFEKGEIKVIEFIADKEGEFPFYCSVPCGSGHGSMNGKLIVE
jgi:cytochrome c oxidase subunit II